MDLITYLEFQTYHKELFWKLKIYSSNKLSVGHSSIHSKDNEQVSECVFVIEKYLWQKKILASNLKLSKWTRNTQQ